MESNKGDWNSVGKSSKNRRYARLIKSGFTANCKRLRWQETCNGTPAPCVWKIVEKSVKEVAVENPLSRGGHTQVAAFGAFFKNR